MRILIAVLLSFASFLAHAEGRCPPGQYPIGGQGAGGCAPISAGGTGGAALSVPTGKWETRWGAVVEDSTNLATGASVSRKSKREATAAAMEECKKQGGNNCKLRVAYHNQCVAIADPTPESRRGRPELQAKSTDTAAGTVEIAKERAMGRCEAYGHQCGIVYSACSMSEFREF